MERIAALFALLVLVFVTGCSVPVAVETEAVQACSGTYVLPQNMSDVENEAFLRAAAKWNEFVGYNLVRFDVVGCEIRIGHIEETEWDGVYNDRDKSITLDRSKFEADDVVIFSEVAIHEIGHSLGFHHTERGMMAPVVEENWSESDRQQCLDLGYCN